MLILDMVLRLDNWRASDMFFFLDLGGLMKQGATLSREVTVLSYGNRSLPIYFIFGLSAF